MTILKNPKTSIKKIIVRILVVILISVVGLIVLTALLNHLSAIGLRRYINRFEPVEYGQDRPVPVYEDGYYCFRTDDDINIMHITDIHIGGGIFTYFADKKTIYEVITMLRNQKPDFVVIGGDNTYCVPFPVMHGGNTLNNRRTAETVIEIFEHEKVYFTTVFGNHDAEFYDIADRAELGRLYADDKYQYSFFESCFSDADGKPAPSVSNQLVLLKGTDNTIRKVILLLDSNSYTDMSPAAPGLLKFDVVRDTQVEWAENQIKKLSAEAGLLKGEYLKCIAFTHSPISEYKVAYDDLFTEIKGVDGEILRFDKGRGKYTEYISGAYGDKKINYGGMSNEGSIEEQDMVFEVLAQKLHSLEAIYCGHDHLNSAVVRHKGVILGYAFSADNEGYGPEIKYSGKQRGANLITVKPDGSFVQENKNAYTQLGCSTDEFVEVYLDKPFLEDWYRVP